MWNQLNIQLHCFISLDKNRSLDKSAEWKIIFLIHFSPKHMLWVFKITVIMRWFFLAPKTHVQIDGQENNYNFTLKKLYERLSLNLPCKITTEVILLSIFSFNFSINYAAEQLDKHELKKAVPAPFITQHGVKSNSLTIIEPRQMKLVLI